VTGRADRWIKRTTIGCVGMLALIAGTVSYLHMHLLVVLHGQPGWVAALTPLSVDGMIIAASTTPTADSRSGGRGRFPAVGAATTCRPANPARITARAAGRDVWLDAWRWAQDSQTEDGSLPSGGEIARQYGRHERWGRLVKRAGLAGELGT
jgi:hypothetical protein